MSAIPSNQPDGPTCISLVDFSHSARTVYVVGQLIYSGGMVLMALTKSAWGVLLFSWSAGVMYSTLFTMPYIIVANYHEKVQ